MASEVMTVQGLSACPRCEGELDYDRQLEKSLREGNSVTLVSVRADVCLRCGEVLLRPGMVEELTHALDLLRGG